MELGTAMSMRNLIGVERRLRMQETEVINGFIGFGKLVFKTLWWFTRRDKTDVVIRLMWFTHFKKKKLYQDGWRFVI